MTRGRTALGTPWNGSRAGAGARSPVCLRVDARSRVIHWPEAPGRCVDTGPLPLRDVRGDREAAPVFPVVGAAVVGRVATIPSGNLLAGFAVGTSHLTGDGEESKGDRSALHVYRLVDDGGFPKRRIAWRCAGARLLPSSPRWRWPEAVGDAIAVLVRSLQGRSIMLTCALPDIGAMPTVSAKVRQSKSLRAGASAIVIGLSASPGWRVEMVRVVRSP
jgi:hypothetical protein